MRKNEKGLWAIGKDEIASHNYKQGEALAMTKSDAIASLPKAGANVMSELPEM